MVQRRATHTLAEISSPAVAIWAKTGSSGAASLTIARTLRSVSSATSVTLTPWIWIPDKATSSLIKPNSLRSVDQEAVFYLSNGRFCLRLCRVLHESRLHTSSRRRRLESASPSGEFRGGENCKYQPVKEKDIVFCCQAKGRYWGHMILKRLCGRRERVRLHNFKH